MRRVYKEGVPYSEYGLYIPNSDTSRITSIVSIIGNLFYKGDNKKEVLDTFNRAAKEYIEERINYEYMFIEDDSMLTLSNFFKMQYDKANSSKDFPPTISAHLSEEVMELQSAFYTHLKYRNDSVFQIHTCRHMIGELADIVILLSAPGDYQYDTYINLLNGKSVDNIQDAFYNMIHYYKEGDILTTAPLISYLMDNCLHSFNMELINRYNNSQDIDEKLFILGASVVLTAALSKINAMAEAVRLVDMINDDPHGNTKELSLYRHTLYKIFDKCPIDDLLGKRRKYKLFKLIRDSLNHW